MKYQAEINEFRENEIINRQGLERHERQNNELNGIIKRLEEEKDYNECKNMYGERL